jgi:tRNA pseudouridine32 synthase/23S rRNA pseudouridine746 synthase
VKRVRFDVDSSPLTDQLRLHLEPVVGRPISSDEILTLLAQGSVYRNRARHKDAESAGGAVEVFWPDLPVVEFVLDPARVVWQDEHLLAVDKPSGVNAAPSPFSDIDCLTWGVARYLGVPRVDAVHRLDRDTQGLMLFAKTKDAERGLHALFRERRVRKVYRAVTPAVETLPVYRWRDTLDWRGRVQTAATTALRYATDDRARLVWTVLPHTGRPHQIRKHFARYLVPLWGDRVYAPGVYGPEEELGLVCVGYRFRHPITGERIEIVSQS